MLKRRTQTNAGLTVIELIIYLGIMSLLTSAVVYSMYVLISTYQRVVVIKNVERSGMVVMDRLSKEIRNASTVISASDGDLQVSSPTGSGTYTVGFSLQNGVVRVAENAVDTGPLSSALASTTSLLFTEITTPKSKAIKIDMTVISSSTRYMHSAHFYDTIILRGSY